MNENFANIQELLRKIAEPLPIHAILMPRYKEACGNEKVERPKAAPVPSECLVMEKVLSTGVSLPVLDKAAHATCLSCSFRKSCSLTTAVFSPVRSHIPSHMVVITTPKEGGSTKWFHQHFEQICEYTYSFSEFIASKLGLQHIAQERQMLKKEITALLSLSGEAILVLNAEGFIVEANQPMCTLLQQSRSQLLGTGIMAFLHEKDWKQMKQGKETDTYTVEPGPQFNRQGKMWKLRVKHIYESGKLYSMLIHIQEEKAGNKKAPMIKRSLHSLDDIKGTSPALKSTKEMAKRIAPSDTTIMIRGESGTGKEMFAQAIHAVSQRRSGAFVAINCAAIPESLLESELFGYEGGAFTGAKGEGKAGRFELANGGTIFLDEIGDMSLHLQAKLLRVVQEKKVERIGGTHSTDIDVRIMAATHRNLERLVAEEKFREDLYYRLHVIPLTIPPLRERREDIPVLIEYFMKKFSKDLIRSPKRLSTQVLERLLHYHWPGNIRELENVVEHFVQLEIGDLVTLHSLPQPIREHSITGGSTPRKQVRTYSRSNEKETILELLDQYGRDTEGKRKVAEKLQMSLPTLYRKLQKWKIR